MSGSATFNSVPIIDVTKENVAVLGPVVRGAIIGADYIAVDCVSERLQNTNCWFNENTGIQSCRINLAS